MGVSHSLNNINIGVGMDSEDGLAIGVGTDLSGVTTSLYWSKSEFKNAVFLYSAPTNGSNDITASQENTGLGVKASMSAGEGATFSVGYSTWKHEQTNSVAGLQGRDRNLDETAKTKQIDVDFTYDLGGGAKIEVGIEKRDAEKLELGTVEGNISSIIKSTDTTTLEAAIAFSF